MENIIFKIKGIVFKDIVLFVGTLDKAHYFKGILSIEKFYTYQKQKFFSCYSWKLKLKKYYMNLSKKLGLKNQTLFVGRILSKDLPLPLIKKLLEEGAEIIAYDPVATLPEELNGNIKLAQSLEDAVKEAEIIKIATDWEHFKELEKFKFKR